MYLKSLIAIGVMFGLSACVPVETAPRTEPVEVAAVTKAPAPSYSIASYRVVVPESLRVSEANVYYPVADIVWRGDEFGDRHQQVKAIFETALAADKPRLKGATRVNVGIEVMRFHCLTEKARFVTGGVNSIMFRMTLSDPKTGKVIGTSRVVNADFNAVGGYAAMIDDRKGLTEKVRVTEHLKNVFLRELSGDGA